MLKTHLPEKARRFKKASGWKKITPLLLSSTLLLSCSSTPDVGGFAEDYAQNKSRYDRYLKTWDLILFQKNDPKGRITFSPDGKVVFEGLLAQKSREFCGTDTTSFILGDRRDNPVRNKLDYDFVDSIIITCKDQEQMMTARWFHDGRLELNFELFRAGYYFVEPSLVQTRDKSSPASKTICNYSATASQLLKKYKGKLNQGRLGGGYDKIQWGMCKEEIAAIYPNHRQIDEGLEVKISEIDATVYFHEGLAYLVAIKDPNDENEKTRAEIIKILNNKYGKPRVINRVTKKDISKNAQKLFRWSNETNVYSDGASEIYADSCTSHRDDSGMSVCTLAETYTKEIRYRSIHLNEEVLKVERAAQRKQVTETEKKY